MLLGAWLGRRFGLDPRTGTLISAGTAICGGSAIAAVSTVIGATEAEIAVSIGTVFLFNALALYLFPLTGQLLHLSQAQFGLWAGVAIHDISSVVGAGLSYGRDALATATAVKLSRTLWIIPLTLGYAYGFGRHRATTRPAAPPPGDLDPVVHRPLPPRLPRAQRHPRVDALAADARNGIPRGMVLVLFLIGTSLSLRALRAVGWRTIVTGLVLWLFISAGSLLAILGLHLADA